MTDNASATRVRHGAAVRRARRSRGLTQAELAAMADCNQGSLADIERGRSGPSLALAQRLARALGTTTSDLFDNAPDAVAS